MKDIKLNFKTPDEEIYSQEELELFRQIEAGNYNPIPKEELEKEKKIAKQTAINTIKRLTKKKSYTMKLSENDIESIKGIALEKGLPYQTFISSVIHQIATKQIKV